MVYPSTATLIAVCVIFCLAIAALRRPWSALALTSYLLGFVLLGSFVKHAYLGMAMTFADMRFFLLRPAANFQLFATYPKLGLTLAAVIAGFAACIFLGLKYERPVALLARPRIGGYLRVAIGLAAILLGVGASFTATQVTQARPTNNDSYMAFLSMYEQQNPQGIVHRLNLFFNNRSFEASLPAKRLQTRFVRRHSDAQIPTSDQMLPDIMIVLQESVFDARLLRDCPEALCDQKLFYPAEKAVRTEQGPLLVHTTGGGTWLAEFAVISGFDWRSFGRGGGYAPVSLAPRLQLSLPKRMRELGYRTVAIYPTDGNFLSARLAYSQYGFDEFYDTHDLGLPDDWLETTDAMVFDKALERVGHSNDTRPVFAFALTIRNHGPHGQQLEKIPTPFLAAREMLSQPMADYLARLHESSQDYRRFADAWLNAERPRVVAWFGDHQPEAAWAFTQQSNTLIANRIPPNIASDQLQYLTYFQMSANFGEPAAIARDNALDLAFIETEIAGFAGLPLDESQQAARMLADECGGLLLTCAHRESVDDYLSFRIYELGAVQ